METIDESNENSWSSKLGFILAATGTAVGLGNIWRLPYLVNQYGGGTFLFFYLLFSFTIGLSVLLAEFTIGRYVGNPFLFNVKNKIKNSFIVSKLLYIYPLALLFLLSFYIVVSGWTLFYFIKSLIGSISYISQNPTYYESIFSEELLGNPIILILFTVLFTLLTAFIVYKGLKGIERVNFIMLPAIFILLGIIIIRVLSLEGSMEGIAYIFSFNTKDITVNAIIAALGQAFFALSLGSGAMIIFGSYSKRSYDIKSSAIQTTNLAVGVGIFASLLIIPAAFAFNVNVSSGPGLTFVTLPTIFSALPLGYIIAPLFFLVMVMAALTSTISILEVCAVFLAHSIKVSKNISILILVIFFLIVGILQALSFGPLSFISIFGKNTFDFAEMMVNFMLIGGGVLSCIIVGWLISKNDIINEVNNNGLLRFRSIKLWINSIKYIIPIVVLLFIFMFI